MKKNMICGLVMLSACSFSHAATLFTDSASFLVRLDPGFYTENFETKLGTFTPASGTEFNGGVFRYNMTATTGPLYSGSGIFGAYNYDSELSINFLDGNINAVGGNFFETDSTDTFLSNSITISLSDGTVVTYTPSAQDDYRGFVADEGVYLTTLTLAVDGSARWQSLDNLTVGAVSYVPEPASTALLGVALITLAATRRRKNARV